MPLRGLAHALAGPARSRRSPMTRGRARISAMSPACRMPRHNCGLRPLRPRLEDLCRVGRNALPQGMAPWHWFEPVGDVRRALFRGTKLPSGSRAGDRLWRKGHGAALFGPPLVLASWPIHFCGLIVFVRFIPHDTHPLLSQDFIPALPHLGGDFLGRLARFRTGQFRGEVAGREEPTSLHLRHDPKYRSLAAVL